MSAVCCLEWSWYYAPVYWKNMLENKLLKEMSCVLDELSV
jgi:hypothetical protein